jgi:hypothetical protein
VVKRFREHVNGKGANFTRLHKPIRVFEQVCSGTCEIKKARDLEDQKALAYAMKFGGDKVKGGRYFFPSKLGKKVQLLKSPGEQKTRQGKCQSSLF